MHELVVNLHMHTRYSDGHGSHADIAQAALLAGLDAVIVTDHNVFVSGQENFYSTENKRVLLMVGEEVHDQARQPQKNHLLVLGVGHEVAPLAYDPQRLLDHIRKSGGLAFAAHPVDLAAPAVNETDISWVDWQLQGFPGLELWNGMSEFKSLLKTKLHAIYYAFNPKKVAHGPFPEALRRWDELLATGQRIVAIGGTDAHALPARLGPFHRVLFPYEFHFRTINNHVLAEKPLTGNLEADRQMILEALAKGRSFIGYDLPASTRGFHFIAYGYDQVALMGQDISIQKGVTLQIHLPRPAECRLIKDGELAQRWEKQENCMYITSKPGVYRVEAYLQYEGRRRGWIFSNPITLKDRI